MESPEQALGAYLPALASAQPTPGGGSAAAVAAQLASALAEMVCAITAGAGRFRDVHFLAGHLSAQAAELRSKLEAARLADETAYARVAAAMKQPKSTDAERQARTLALEDALAHAAAAPLAIASLAFEAASLCERALELGNANLVTDLGCAALFAAAASRAAGLNVRVNHKFMKDTALIEKQAAELHALELATRDACERVLAETDRLLAV